MVSDLALSHRSTQLDAILKHILFAHLFQLDTLGSISA
jgi:hypothetical protein